MALQVNLTNSENGALTTYHRLMTSDVIYKPSQQVSVQIDHYATQAAAQAKLGSVYGGNYDITDLVFPITTPAVLDANGNVTTPAVRQTSAVAVTQQQIYDFLKTTPDFIGATDV